jgi:hypothetical protein
MDSINFMTIDEVIFDEVINPQSKMYISNSYYFIVIYLPTYVDNAQSSCHSLNVKVS